MKKITLTLLIISFLLFLNPLVFAKSTIYKCLDEFGRPIFSQQATCAKPETVNYSSKQLADKKKKLEVEKRKSEELKQQQQCHEAKTIYNSYKRAPFLTKMILSDGKEIKVRLSKEEAKLAITEAEQEKDYWCKK
ncbi:MAG: hypothetical protein QM479_02430 [Pseudomonadota bacterium]